jgi:hypothetical protein
MPASTPGCVASGCPAGVTSTACDCGRELHYRRSDASLQREAGYADQAHMTRRFRCLFGKAPGQFSREEALMCRAGDPGFAG